MHDFLDMYKWIIIGGILGILIALLIVFLGFFKTIFILFCGLIGSFLGYYLSREGILPKLKK